jgi:hypothetical protein
MLMFFAWPFVYMYSAFKELILEAHGVWALMALLRFLPSYFMV